MTLGSLFDGIGGWLLAARHAGVTPVWSSEIEAFPCTVTKQHFPEVLQLGDITKLNGAEIPPVDIVCAGSPCQDLSIAGTRKGLDGARSGLFRVAVELVRDMRRATHGRYPRFFVWENVPGAFSSNRGMDFQAVLEEIGESKIPMPQGNRWAPAGLVQFPGAEIAWRVLDAQYWGVPQRRRRIFLVADFAAHDRRAAEILFECEGVQGNPQESKRAGERTAGGVGNGAEKTDMAYGLNVWDSVAFESLFLLETTPTMVSSKRIGVVKTICNVLTPWDVQSRRIYDENGTMAALYSGGEGRGSNNGAVLVRTAGFVGKAAPSAGNIGYAKELAPTLLAGKERHVAIYDMTHADEVMRPAKDGIAPTLNARMGTGGNQVPVVHCIGDGQVNQIGLHEKAGALTCRHDQQAVVCYNICSYASGAMQSDNPHSGIYKTDTTRTLDLNGGSPVCNQGGTMVVGNSTVRRLTPLEAERLQGLPDGYTEGGSDTARYNALGNGMAQPCADWVIRRIKEATT